MPILPSLGNVRVSLSVMIDDCSAAQDGTLKWLTQKAGARKWSSPQHVQPKEGHTEAAFLIRQHSLPFMSAILEHSRHPNQKN